MLALPISLSLAQSPAQDLGATTTVPPRDPRLKALQTTDTQAPPDVTAATLQGNANITGSRPLTADEAVKLAIKLQPGILSARAALNAQKGRTQQVSAGLRPQVQVAGSYNRATTLNGVRFGAAATAAPAGTSSSGSTTTTTGGTGTSTTTTATTTSTTNFVPSIGVIVGADVQATLKQLIFDFNHTRDLVKQSRALDRAADQNLAKAIADASFEVKQAFYQYRQGLNLARVYELEVQNRQSQLDLAQSRYNVGLGQPVDVYSAQTAKSEAVLNLQVARDNAEQARITLTLAIGIDPRTPIQLAEVDEPAAPATDVNALVTMALKQRPEALQARETLRATGYAFSAARSTNAPIVSGAMNVISEGDQFVPQNDYLTVGVTLSWSAFDGGLTRGRTQEARANIVAAKSQLVAVEQTIKADVSSAFVNLRSVEGRVTVANAEVANAEQNVQVAEMRYRTGVGQFVDIINAQAFLLNARSNQVNTLALIPQYRAAIQHAVGAGVSIR